MPPALNLSSEHIAAWWGKFPLDLRASVFNDASSESDKDLMEVVADLASAPARRFLDVIDMHAGSIATMGMARRVRLLAWLVSSSWPDTNLARDLMRADEDEGGEGARGRAKVAPLFRSDYIALTAFCGRRQVHGVRSLETVETLHAGIQGVAELGSATGM